MNVIANKVQQQILKYYSNFYTDSTTDLITYCGGGDYCTALFTGSFQCII